MLKSKTQVALNAVVATTTSSKFYVGDAKKVALLFRRADNAGGTSAFTVKASLDEMGTVTPIMTALNLWIDNVANANSETLTRVAGKCIANADGDVFLFLDPTVHINWVEITATETGDGTHSAFIVTQEED